MYVTELDKQQENKRLQDNLYRDNPRTCDDGTVSY